MYQDNEPTERENAIQITVHPKQLQHGSAGPGSAAYKKILQNQNSNQIILHNYRNSMRPEASPNAGSKPSMFF